MRAQALERSMTPAAGGELRVRPARLLGAALALGLWIAPSNAWFVTAWLAFLAWGASRARAGGGGRRPLLAGACATFGVAPFLAPDSAPLWLALGLGIGAGAVPAHLWMEDVRRSLSRGDFALVLIAQPSVALVHAFLALHPEALGASAEHVLQNVLVATSILQAGLGLVRRDPQRALGAIVLSQSSLVMAGAVAGGTGWTAARMLLFSVMVSSLVLLVIVFELRRRFGATELSQRNALASAAPGLHRLFALAGWLFVGLPGGAAFFAEDLLFHALVHEAPAATLGFIVAAGLNALGFYRIYLGLFCGARRPASSALLTGAESTSTPGWLSAVLVLAVAALLATGFAPDLLLP